LETALPSCADVEIVQEIRRIAHARTVAPASIERDGTPAKPGVQASRRWCRFPGFALARV
jgi:hypothetical protein